MPTEPCTATDEENETAETSVSSVGEVPANNVENTAPNEPPDSVLAKPLQPPIVKPLATESPSKRSFRNKIKLAANFSFSSTPSV